jgi:hypothetical protein
VLYGRFLGLIHPAKLKLYLLNSNALVWFLNAPPKDFGPQNVLLGGGGIFQRWDLVGSLSLIGSVPLKGIVRPTPFYFLFFTLQT